jgi:GT2 family glycosyltransferase
MHPLTLPIGAATSDAARSRAGVSAIDLSAILVSYNTEHLLQRAIGDLKAAAKSVSLQIVIVDNASRDGSVERIRREHPECELIVNAKNAGFGRANNQALERARGRYVLLLNTDAFVSPDTLCRTLAYMEANPRCGILGAQLVGRDGAPQPSARYFPTPWNLFLARTGLARFFPRTRLVDNPQWRLREATRCDWVPGCYYLVRREVIDEVGLFDPRYFLYYEEVDHCFAARRAGWEVLCYPHATVIHLGGESARTEGPLSEAGRQIEAMQTESELLFFRKNYGPGAALAASLLLSLADLISVLKRLLRGRRPFGAAERWRHSASVWSLVRRTRLGASPTR